MSVLYSIPKNEAAASGRLESLKAYCECEMTSCENGSSIWAGDIAALDIAINNLNETIRRQQGCVYCSDWDREPELQSIELYEGCDKEGCKYYYLDIHRPTGYIPEPWRNRVLHIRYCPLCGKKLLEE